MWKVVTLQYEHGRKAKEKDLELQDVLNNPELNGIDIKIFQNPVGLTLIYQEPVKTTEDVDKKD